MGIKYEGTAKGKEAVCRGTDGKFGGQRRDWQGAIASLSASHCTGPWETQR